MGQYLLLDSDAGFLGLSNSNPFNQAQLIQFLRTGTDFLSGLGDLAEVIEPLKPVSDGVRQAGESLGEAIDQQSAVSSSDTTPFAQAEPGFLTVWEIIPASQQNSFRFRQLVTQQFLATQGEGLALVSGEAEAGSFVLQPCQPTRHGRLAHFQLLAQPQVSNPSPNLLHVDEARMDGWATHYGESLCGQ